MDFTWLGLQIHISWSQISPTTTGGSEMPVSGVTTICLKQCDTSSHRVDQVVDCGPLLFNDSMKLLDIGRNWNMLLYTPIQSIPNMHNGRHVWWVCRPCKNWDDFSFQELQILATWSRALWGDGGGWMARQWASGSQYLCAFKLLSIKCTCVHCP